MRQFLRWPLCLFQLLDFWGAWMRTLTIAVVALVIDQVWLWVLVRSFGWWVGLLVGGHCFVACFNDFQCVLCIFWLLRSGMIQMIFVRGCPPKFQNSHGWLENFAGFHKVWDFFRWLYRKKSPLRGGFRSHKVPGVQQKCCSEADKTTS